MGVDEVGVDAIVDEMRSRQSGMTPSLNTNLDILYIIIPQISRKFY